MTRVKSNRIFLGIVTACLALAGTGLTIANNWPEVFEIKMAAIAITLAACFSAAEFTFLWAHKRFEGSVGLWRKTVLAISCGLLVCSMAYAVSEELKLALAKVSNRSLAGDSAQIVNATDKRRQGIVASKALTMIGANKIQANHVPFVVCYLITGLVSIAILACTQRQQERKLKGNQVPNSPTLRAILASRGFDPDVVKAYSVSGGYSVYENGRYKGFVKAGEAPEKEKRRLGFL